MIRQMLEAQVGDDWDPGLPDYHHPPAADPPEPFVGPPVRARTDSADDHAEREAKRQRILDDFPAEALRNKPGGGHAFAALQE